MLKIKFRRRIWKNLDEPSVIRRISTTADRSLRQLATKLQKRSDRWSVRRKKWFLFAFVLIFGGVSLYITWNAIARKSASGAVSVRSITVCPMTNGMDTRGSESRHGGISSKEYEVVRAFHHYLDSLGGSAGGTAIRDSLLLGRPGLVDSLEEIERMYLEK